MQIAEEADTAAIGPNGREHARLTRLGYPFRLHRLAVLVHGLKPAAVQEQIGGILATQHRVGLRSRRYENGFRRQARGLARGTHLASGFVELV